MRTSNTVMAGFAVVVAIVTANLWRELRAERLVTAGLQSQLSESNERVRVALEQARQVETAMPVSVAAVIKPVDTVVARPEPAGAKPAQPVTNTSLSQVLRVEQDLMQDPDYRKARLTMLRSSIAQTYPGLVEELGLSEAEARKLFDLLAEGQMALTSTIVTTAGGQVDQAAMAEVARNRQAQQRQQEEQIRTMLGDARYPQWQGYQSTRGARVQANSFATSLAQAGMPLGKSQIKSLEAVVISEQKSMQQDLQNLARSVNQADPQARSQVQESFQARQAEGNQRILEGARPYLTPEQERLLRAQFEQQDAVNRAAARVRERTQVLQVPQ